MKFTHQVIHDGKLYYAGEEVPVEIPKPEKVEESPSFEEKVEEEPMAEPKKPRKKK